MRLALTPGNTADITGAALLLDQAPRMKRLIADRGYDANALRARLRGQGTTPVIPGLTQPQTADPIRQAPLSRPLAGRSHVLPPEGLPPRRNPIRQARKKLPVRRRPRSRRRVLVLIESQP